MEGRFIQKDPIGIKGGINLYSYVGDSPINKKDPYGLVNPGEAACAAGPNPICIVGVLADIATFVAGVAVLQCKSKPDENKCDKQYYDVDIPMCRGVTRKYGNVAGQRCYASAAERYAACLTGKPIPPLDTWRN